MTDQVVLSNQNEVADANGAAQVVSTDLDLSLNKSNGFQYPAIDPKRMFRFVKMLPLALDRTVQCTLETATTISKSDKESFPESKRLQNQTVSLGQHVLSATILSPPARSIAPVRSISYITPKHSFNLCNSSRSSKDISTRPSSLSSHRSADFTR